MAKVKENQDKKKLRRVEEFAVDQPNERLGRGQHPLKVIHAPLNFAGQAYLLSQALRGEGIDSISYRITTRRGSAVDVYGYKDDRLIEFTWGNQLGDLFRGVQEIISEQPDIVHLWHRSVIYGKHGDAFNGMDLPFLRLGGARIALRFTGYELRRKSLEMQLNPYSPFYYGFESGFSEDDQKKFYDFVRPFVDTFIVQDPEMQTYCPEARIVPRVLDLAKFPVVEPRRNRRPVVVHAPTDDLLKGTKFVLKAVEELKDEGLDFDFLLIKDMPNAEALEHYRRADVVIDQLLIGWYGVLAMETMAMGKAVIAYIRDDLTGHLGRRLPLLNANPDTLRDVLRQSIKDAQLRKEVGQRARAFAEATHDSRAVARNLIKIYGEMLKTPDRRRIPDFSYQAAHAQKVFMSHSFDQDILMSVRRALPTFSLDELKQKLEFLADAEPKPAWDGNTWNLVRRIPAETQEELERKLELLADAGALDEVERKLTYDAKLADRVRQIPATTSEELERKLELLAKAGTLADVERRLSWEANPWALVRRIPAESPQELEEKLELLANGGTLREVQRKLTSDPHLLEVVHRIPAENPKELERKLDLLAQAGSLDDVERKLIFDANLMRLVRKVPAANPQELERKLDALAKAGTLDEIERKIGLLSPSEANLLKLLRRIPAKSDREREEKIAALIPKRQRAAAIAEERWQTGDYNSYLVRLTNRIPAANYAELEAKIAGLIPKKKRASGAAPNKRRADWVSVLVGRVSRAVFSSLEEWNRRKVNPRSTVNFSIEPDDRIVVPTTLTPSAAAFSAFEENLLKLVRRVPAKNISELQKKIASLIAENGRAVAIARSREHSADEDSFLVNLVRHIGARNPQELDFKLSSLIPPAVETAPPPDGRGTVCIVTRKPIRNVTRGPRMAKALSDAGYRVVVVSPAPPVDELRDMCPEVEYIVADYRAFTYDVTNRLETRQKARRARLDERERDYRTALAKGGWRALLQRSRRAIKSSPPVQAITRLSWQVFVVTPSAWLLKSETQNFREVWDDLAGRDATGIAVKFVWYLTQWASSHAFAAKADELTAGRHFDVVQAYDNYALVAGARLAARTGAKLIYDAVEIATDRVAQDLNLVERIRERLERREEAGIFLNAERMIGTGDALAGWYVERYRVPKPIVLRNCRYFWPYRKDGRLRADIGAGPDTRVLLWCGSAYPQQGIELAIRALPHLPANIHLAVVTEVTWMWKKYITEELPAIAQSFGVADRVHILPERSPNDLVPYISDGDLGFVLSIPVNHPNQYYNLPNKFFECIMARLPIGTLAFPEVVNIVNEFQIGSVLDEHDTVKNAAAIQAMLEPERYAVLKANVMKAAETLCWENESKPYVELIDSLMPTPYRENAFASRGEMLRGNVMLGMPPAGLAAQAGTD